MWLFFDSILNAKACMKCSRPLYRHACLCRANNSYRSFKYKEEKYLKKSTPKQFKIVKPYLLIKYSNVDVQ